MRAVPTSPVVYRETIRHFAGGERKYIRYYDGRGHFGHVALQLVPHPGELCTVTTHASCHLPEEGCAAIRSALFRRFERGPVQHLPLLGIEARLTGGSWLPPYSNPEACAAAACMAFDEALQHAAPFVVEPYVGVHLLVELHALAQTVKTLAGLLGEVRGNHAVTDIVRLDVEIPVRLTQQVRSALQLRMLDTFPLSKDTRYRPVLAVPPAGSHNADALPDWT